MKKNDQYVGSWELGVTRSLENESDSLLSVQKVTEHPQLLSFRNRRKFAFGHYLLCTIAGLWYGKYQTSN